MAIHHNPSNVVSAAISFFRFGSLAASRFVSSMSVMMSLVRRCWHKLHPTYVTSDNIVYGTPLVSAAMPGYEVSAPSAWGMTLEQQTLAGQQAVWYNEAPFEQVIDIETGGMLADATSYKTSFFVEGAKFVSPDPEGRVMVVFSTAYSNILSRYDHTKPYLTMDVYESWSDGHTRACGKGMDTAPGGLNECVYKESVDQVFSHLDFSSIWNLEQLFDAAGITVRTYFICGYHIHGTSANVHDGRFCALDWYAQTGADHSRNPEEWDHYLILDEVCPTECYKARVFRRMDAFYGWTDHAIGGR